MTEQEKIRLRDLLKQLRGNTSVREYCRNVKICTYSAWGGWEKMESEPKIQNYEAIAELKGWTLQQLYTYLKTGSPEEPDKISLKRLYEIVGQLRKEEKKELLHHLVEISV